MANHTIISLLVNVGFGLLQCIVIAELDTMRLLPAEIGLKDQVISEIGRRVFITML